MTTPLEQYLDYTLDRGLTTLLGNGKIDYNCKEYIVRSWFYEGGKQQVMQTLVYQYGNAVTEQSINESVSTFIYLKVEDYAKVLVQQNIPIGSANLHYGNNMFQPMQTNMAKPSHLSQLYASRSSNLQNNQASQTTVVNTANNVINAAYTPIQQGVIKNMNMLSPLTETNNDEVVKNIVSKSNEVVRINKCTELLTGIGAVLYLDININIPVVDVEDAIGIMSKHLSELLNIPKCVMIRYPKMHMFKIDYDYSRSAFDTMYKQYEDGKFNTLRDTLFKYNFYFAQIVGRLLVNDVNKLIKHTFKMANSSLPYVENVEDIEELLLLNDNAFINLITDSKYVTTMSNVIKRIYNKYFNDKNSRVLNPREHLGYIQQCEGIKILVDGGKINERTSLITIDEEDREKVFKAYEEYTVLSIDNYCVYTDICFDEQLMKFNHSSIINLNNTTTVLEQILNEYITKEHVDVIMKSNRLDKIVSFYKGLLEFGTIPALFA